MRIHYSGGLKINGHQIPPGRPACFNPAAPTPTQSRRVQTTNRGKVTCVHCLYRINKEEPKP